MKSPLTILPPSAISKRQREQPGRVIGIDLGTTNSAVAEIALGAKADAIPEVHCLPIAQPTELSEYVHALVPSVVALSGGIQYIGEGAKRLRAKAADRRLKEKKDIFWECKNDMGLRRTYHLAPEGYRSAPEIAAKILSLIKEESERAGTDPICRWVITVPASFQTAQRTDTVRAAKLAGIPLHPGDLLDEPVAAFLDYLLSYPERIGEKLAGEAHLLVFDFGGGTCDVAIFDLAPRDTGIDISPRAVSRFHRLGGGDIDRAIVHNVLIPQLCRENRLNAHDLDYRAKRLFLEPALLGVAEALKVQLCEKTVELGQFGQGGPEARKSLVAVTAPTGPIKVADQSYTLSEPKLFGADFEKVMEPFIDRDLLCARENEYFLTNSIFAPLQDSLNRAGLDRSVISLVLMVGGSSLIPQVQESVTAFFKEAAILCYEDAERVQTTVARGAAIHAYTLELFHKPLFRPVAHDSICIVTNTGPHELIRKGEPLILAEDDSWRIFDGLAIAKTNLVSDTVLRVEFAVPDKGFDRLLFRELWRIPPAVSAGESIRLEYRFTQDQVFEFRVSLLDDPGRKIAGEIENPLTHVVNPHSVRMEIEEIEEQMRNRAIPRHLLSDTAVELAEKYAELGQNQRAIAFLQDALQVDGHSSPRILNLLGIYHGREGDRLREEKFYREASRTGKDTAPLFNLALAQKNRREYESALETIREIQSRKIDGPTLTLKVLVMDALKITEGRVETLNEAVSLYPAPPLQTKWEFDWFRTAAKLKLDPRLDKQITEESQRRASLGEEMPPDGELPVMRMSLVPCT